MRRWVLGLLLSIAVSASTEIPIYQLDMMSAGFLTTGATPAFQNDIGSIFANPATIGYSDTPQFFATSYQRYDAFNYLSGAYSRPIGKWRWAIGYGSATLDEITRTERQTISGQDRIVATGDFSSGLRMGYLAVARPLADQLMGLRDVSVGVAGKFYQQFVDTDTRDGMGVDLGLQATTAIQNRLFNRLDVGVSALNISSTLADWDSELGVTGSESVESAVLIGFRGYHLNNKLQTFWNSNAVDGTDLGLAYYTDKSLVMRAGTNTGTGSNQLGLGFLLNELLDWGKTGYTLQLDYSYSIHPDYDVFNTHAISLSLVGDVSRKKPKIMYPPTGLKTYETQTTLGGFGNPNARILVYNNASLVMSTNSNADGSWEIAGFPIDSGINRLSVKAYTQTGSYTELSEPVVITGDHEAPLVDTVVRFVSDGLSFVTQSDEPLYDIQATVDDVPLAYSPINSRYWEAVMPWELSQVPLPVPNTAPRFRLLAFDEVGNESDPVSYPLFFELKTVKDKQQISQRFVRLSGQASPFITQLTVNQTLMTLSESYQFDHLFLLQPGRNTLIFEAVLNSGQTQQYYLDITSVRSFGDSQSIPEQGAIETITSLGILTREGNRFYPNEAVTRGDFVNLLVQLNQLDTSATLTATVADIPDPNTKTARAVQAVMAAGWMMGTGTGFGVDDPMTEKQAWTVLNRAKMVPLDTDPGIQDQVLTRKRLAVLLLTTYRVQAIRKTYETQ